MLQELSNSQAKWVESTLNSMTMEELVGLLICPESRKYTQQDWLDIFDKVPLGNIFFGNNNAKEMKNTLTAIQNKAKHPVIVAVDMEQGMGLACDFGTNFPEQMALAAAGDTELTREMGRILAREVRPLGVHWTFSPVADLNYNFNNPVTNIRSFGDDAAKVAEMVKAAVQGRQENGLLAATVKHFPGDGMDDRDQHACTSVNTMPMDQWRETYGKVWKAAIHDAGVMSIMSGHISLPDYQGYEIDPEEAMPATLCHKLQVDLLRNELGFKGVLVSDAAPMIGITSRVSAEDMAVENIVNGSDVFLFAEPVEDHKRLMRAVKSGRLSEERVYESARRVLEMKARLNIHENPFGIKLTEAEVSQNIQSAQKAADKSITLLKNNGKLPVSLKKGAKVLTVTLTYKEHSRKPADLEYVDKELIARGFEVDHLFCPEHNALIGKAGDYDAVFLNFLVTMHMKLGTIRATAEAIMPLWRAFYKNCDNVVCTSFGNPYLSYEQPHLPNLYLTYGASEVTQKAAVKCWLGEIKAEGICPVHQPKVEIKRINI